MRLFDYSRRKHLSSESNNLVEDPNGTEALNSHCALLEVDGCDDVESVATHLNTLSRSTKSRNNALRIIEGELSEAEDILNDVIARVVFFFDLHVIQENVRDIWRSYRKTPRI